MPGARLENVYNNFVYAAEELEEALSALRGGDRKVAKDRISSALEDLRAAMWHADKLSPVTAYRDPVLAAVREIVESAFSALDGSFLGAYVEPALDRLDSAVQRLAGEGCKVPGVGVESVIASVASCLRKAADKLAASVRKVGKCDVVAGSSPAAVKACAAWSAASDELDRRDLYTSGDYRRLWGYVSGGKVYIDVQAGPWSRAEIDLDSGTVSVENVGTVSGAKAVEELLQRIGLSCSRRDVSVTCTGVNPSNATKVASALAFVTSISVRIEYPSTYWGTESLIDREVTFAEKTLKEIEPQVEEVLKMWSL